MRRQQVPNSMLYYKLNTIQFSLPPNHINRVSELRRFGWHWCNGTRPRPVTTVIGRWRKVPTASKAEARSVLRLLDFLTAAAVAITGPATTG
jgi:hypothetical protein